MRTTSAGTSRQAMAAALAQSDVCWNVPRDMSCKPEICRGGILSVNIGQTEAGRSLGMTHKQTMASIVMPQAMKNILPALGNEFVVLIKETAVIGMIANIDLVGAARKVQSLTYDYLIPLLSIAVIYYVVIKIISTLLSKVEKGMRKADKR